MKVPSGVGKGVRKEKEKQIRKEKLSKIEKERKGKKDP
jgi:hypothetical protein